MPFLFLASPEAFCGPQFRSRPLSTSEWEIPNNRLGWPDSREMKDGEYKGPVDKQIVGNVVP